MYKVKEVAERLNLSPAAVYQMVTDQAIRHHRTGAKGRSIRFTEQVLLSVGSTDVTLTVAHIQNEVDSAAVPLLGSS